jgi:hypothetical protein
MAILSQHKIADAKIACLEIGKGGIAPIRGDCIPIVDLVRCPNLTEGSRSELSRMRSLANHPENDSTRHSGQDREGYPEAAADTGTRLGARFGALTLDSGELWRHLLQAT